jgi:hypothetical protein
MRPSLARLSAMVLCVPHMLWVRKDHQEVLPGEAMTDDELNEKMARDLEAYGRALVDHYQWRQILKEREARIRPDMSTSMNIDKGDAMALAWVLNEIVSTNLYIGLRLEYVRQTQCWEAFVERDNGLQMIATADSAADAMRKLYDMHQKAPTP